VDFLDLDNLNQRHLTRVLTAVATLTFFWVCRRLFRLRSRRKLSPADYKVLRGYADKRFGTVAIPTLIVWVVCGYGCYVGLEALVDYRNTVAWGDTPVIWYGPASKVPGWIEWAVPSTVLGFFCAWWASAVFIRLAFGRAQAADYRTAASHAAGYDVTLLRRVATAAGVPATLIGVVLLYDCYERFGVERFSINEPWSLGEKVYDYSQIKAVVVTTHTRGMDGKERPFSWLYLILADGSHWCTAPAGDYSRLIDFLERKTGRQVVVVRQIEEVIGGRPGGS
jgi:hypothetical protein